MPPLGAQLREKLAALPLAGKIKWARDTLRQALGEFGTESTLLAWTGGKDSTLILWILEALRREEGLKMPRSLFIDEGHVFPEILAFVEEVEERLGLAVDKVRNDDVYNLAGGKVGSEVEVASLSPHNRAEVARLGWEGESFPFEPESLVGNHLMKTVALNVHLRATGAAALITGIRWDEQGARNEERPTSPRTDPPHTRIHPILPFTERDVWDAHSLLGIPSCSLYRDGYRSLGAAGTTTKSGDVPAWEQDLEATTERSGRRQDKEGAMGRLRDLGYM